MNNIPEDLIFISAQPHNTYFQWQIEVQIVNFRKFGVSNKMHILVWYPKGSDQMDAWADLQQKYPEVNIFMYEDTGVNLGLYISQLRPHILKKHFRAHEEYLKGKTFFYHDSDIIFRELPDFEKLVQGDICWQSDTSSYLDYSYMRSKEEQGKIPFEEAVKKFASIGGIPVDVIKSYDKKTGGAQYILRGIDSDFWQDIEDQCVAIRSAFFYEMPESINRKYFYSENEGFQSWCADMWAINFAMWKRGMKTDITPLLDFSWATDSIETYNKKPIFHNAGADASRKDIFYKGFWINRSPLYIEHKFNKKMASSMYVKAIMDVK